MGWMREKVRCLIHEHILTWRGLALGSIAVLFWLLAFPILAPWLIPASVYLDVRGISVADTWEGGPVPAVTIDRDIRQTFVGSYVSRLRQIDGDGALWTFCDEGRRDELQFTAGRPYPGHDLDWWLGSPPKEQCPLVAGRYQLRITWSVPIAMGLATTTITRESPPFSVRENPGAFPGLPPELRN